MSVEVKSESINVRERLAQILPKEIQPNFGGMPSVKNTLIVESGSNANGNWIKYEDGTMICTHLVTPLAPSASSGGIFQSPSYITWVFPKEFITHATTAGNTASDSRWITITRGTTQCYIRQISSATSNTEVDSVILAIGKWR